MTGRWPIWMLALLVTAASGCNESPPSATPRGIPKTPEDAHSTASDVKHATAPSAPQGASGTPASEAEKQESVPAPVEGPPPAAAVSAAPPTGTEKDRKPAPVPEGSADDALSQAKPEPKKAATKPERIAIFTPGGPLLMDVAMTLDGHPYNEAFDAQLAALMKAADSDGDGTATWKELMDNETFLKGLASGPAAMNERQKRDAIKQYDLNEDGYLQKQEATAWLGRDSGRSAAAFRVRSSRAYAPDSRTHSRVWPFLDRDADGVLSAAELDGAGAALLGLDADDDQVLTLDELASLREQLLGQNQLDAASDATRDAALHLEPGYDVERLDYMLPDMYSPHQTLGPESFPALPNLFAQLDESGEEWLDRDELARLLTIEPHVTLAVDFDSAAMAEQPAAKVTLLGNAEEVRLVGESAPSRLVLALGATRLAISATGAAAQAGPAMTYGGGSQHQLELMVHDQEDALFEELDANGDGRLGTREMTACRERLAARDADGDGAVAADELPYSMTVAFLRGAGTDGFYTPPRGAPLATRAEEPAWFRQADFNGDGDLSHREFLGELARFQELDGDGDGFVDAREAANAQQDAPPTSTSVRAQAKTEGP